MRALFVDANRSLAEVTERLLRPGDPSVTIHRDPDIPPADAAAACSPAMPSRSTTTPSSRTDSCGSART